ncbi:MAG: alpha/beta fold hydrolase [Burkholderiales bacterium]
MFPGFERRQFDVGGGITINGVVGGSGPPLLLLHGHPQTHVMWHKVALRLAERFTVVATDLRGYGDSSRSEGLPDHGNYAKRAMAADQVAVMRALGFDRFMLCGHDRGARVAHRLAADHADRVQKLALLDISPTLAMYEQTSKLLATLYFHWFFLIQPRPLPETMIGANPDFYYKSVMGGRWAGLGVFAPEALAEYSRCWNRPETIHAMCEDYRAAATIDLEHDRADRDAGNRVRCPLLVLWGENGVIEKCFKPLEDWGRVAADVQGHAVPSGHYIPEETPDLLVQELISYFGSK